MLAPIVGGIVVIAVLAAFGLSLLGGNRGTTPPISQRPSAGSSAGATKASSGTPASDAGGQQAGSAQASDGGGTSTSTPTVAAASDETIVFYAVREGNPDVYVANTDGTGLRRLTNAPGADSDPAWSPDRTKIAFESHAPAPGLPGAPGQYAQVWVMNADGSDAHPLTHAAATSAHAAWSPDGTRIAFDSDRGDGSTLQIFVMNADGSDQHAITSIPGGASFAAWSPGDPSVIAFDALSTGEIWAVAADGSGSPRRLIEGKAAYPAWSADGSHLAFSTTRDGGYQIYIANPNGSSLEPLTSGLAHAVSPSWSPDGGRIVFEDGIRSTSGLFVIELSSGNISPFLPNQNDVHRPSWH